MAAIELPRLAWAILPPTFLCRINTNEGSGSEPRQLQKCLMHWPIRRHCLRRVETVRLAGAMTNNPVRPVRVAQPPVKLRESPDIAQTGGGVAAKAAGFPRAVAAHDASTNLTEWDEPVAVETRGDAEAYMETLCDVLGLGCQWADFARRTCV